MTQKLTPIAQLIEFCEYRQSKSTTGNKAAWNMILAKIKDDELLSEEKQMVIDAYKAAITIDLSIESQINEAEQYFKQNFKQ